jgi:hypothetical protein
MFSIKKFISLEEDFFRKKKFGSVDRKMDLYLTTSSNTFSVLSDKREENDRISDNLPWLFWHSLLKNHLIDYFKMGTSLV